MEIAILGEDKRFVNVGYNNVVNIDLILSVMPVESAPNRRLIQLRKQEFLVLDCTGVRKSKTMIITNEKYIILLALKPETINLRLCKNGSNDEDKSHSGIEQKKTGY